VTIVTVFFEIDNIEVQKPSQKCLDATAEVFKVFMTPKDAHTTPAFKREHRNTHCSFL